MESTIQKQLATQPLLEQGKAFLNISDRANMQASVYGLPCNCGTITPNQQ